MAKSCGVMQPGADRFSCPSPPVAKHEDDGRRQAAGLLARARKPRTRTSDWPANLSRGRFELKDAPLTATCAARASTGLARDGCSAYHPSAFHPGTGASDEAGNR